MTSGLQDLLDRITPFHVTLGMSVVSVLLVSLCTISAYSTDDALPPPGPPPAAVQKASLRNARYMPTFYRSLIEDDCKKAGIAPTSPRRLALPNAFRREFSGRQRLGTRRSDSSLQTASLLLRLQQRKIWIGAEGRRVRPKHLVLKITNQTNRYLAYRVVTELTSRGRPLGKPSPCGNKAAVAHNGIALAPGKTVERTECLVLRRARFYVRAVEILELRPLSYQYVSRIEPRALLISNRATEGHEPAKLPICRRVPWDVISAGIDNGHFRWYDVVDFYARHNCDEYTFYPTYRWSPRGISGELPLKPPSMR